MGAVVSYRSARKPFNATLAPCAAGWLKVAISGYTNVNLIINQQGMWPLEFTSRFGYPGFAMCQASHTEPWHFRPGLGDEDRAALHFAEVEQIGGQLVTIGATSCVSVATGNGRTIADATADAYRIANYVVLPNLRYRMDMGQRVKAHDRQALRALGWLSNNALDR